MRKGWTTDERTLETDVTRPSFGRTPNTASFHGRTPNTVSFHGRTLNTDKSRPYYGSGEKNKVKRLLAYRQP